MKKIPLLLFALLLLIADSIMAGDNKVGTKAQFQFTSFAVTQNSWDYALLRYNVNDLETGESLDIPSFLINYEVKDKAGKVVSSGSGLYVKVMDNKLGSEEDYTIAISTMINGEKISQSVCKKASPKKFAMKVNSNNTDLADFKYTCSRPKYSNPNETENIQLTASDVSVAVSLNNCTGCATYKIDATAKLAEQADYKNMEKEIKKMTKDGGNIQMTIDPTVVFKGETYKDGQSHYEVTASGISELNGMDAMASK